MTRTALITGTSTGFGRLAAQRFQREGWNVVATMRAPDRESELGRLDRVLVARLDTAEPASIGDALRLATREFGGVDVLVNNAGVGAHGLFENYSDEEGRAIYETNVFGTLNVCRAVLPLMRARRSGRVINVTSVAGLVGGPGTVFYSGSKFAVEGFSESLAMEYAAWGIRVHTIAPGGFDTRFAASANDAWDRGEGEYGEYSRVLGHYMEEVIAGMKRAGGKPADPADVADLIYRCATEDMPIHNVAGPDAEALAQQMADVPRQQFLEGMLSRLPGLER